MNLRNVLFVILLLAPSTAYAAPITSGTWSSVSAVANPFWNGTSWDCPTCGAISKLQAYAGLDGLEFLHNGTGGYTSFRFDDPVIDSQMIFNDTAWKNGTFGRNSTGAFTYDSGTGRISDSWLLPGQYALFRKRGAVTTQYFLGIEDILLSEAQNDRDYNDYGVKFSLPTQQIPEPSTLFLLGMGTVGAAASRRRRMTTR